jgi:ABC-type polysaccharide/polyol phosphate export permease
MSVRGDGPAIDGGRQAARPGWLLDLWWTLMERQWRIRAKRSYVGIVWPVISPVGLALLYVLIFKRVFAVPIERYPQYLVCGLLPWTFLSISISRSVSSVSGDADVVRKARFPYELLPLTTVVNQALVLLFNFACFAVFLAITGDLRWTLLPLAVGPLVSVVLFTCAIAMVVSVVDVYTRDLRFIVGNLISVWFFLVPIIYRPRMAPSYLRWYQRFDPVSSIVGQLRSVLYVGQAPAFHSMALTLIGSTGLFVFSLLFFRRRSRDFGALL